VSYEDELRLRERIMELLTLAVAVSEDGSLSRGQLEKFDVDGVEWRLIDASRGIRNPKKLEATLAIVSSPTGPYADEPLDSGLFRYDYRSGSDAGDNTKLRRAYELNLPLILFRKIATGLFTPTFPVYIVADDRAARQVYIALDESLRFLRDPMNPEPDERRYAQRVTRQRLHQPAFRARVLRAYEVHCAVCSLRHGNLLDAAHITPDAAEGGSVAVSNGLSLCKIHHAAYDDGMLGISPDYQVHIAAPLLLENGGPMLLHGIQEMNGRTIVVPKKRNERPDPDRLAERFRLFRDACDG
jgi:putative restriction endonuclease